MALEALGAAASIAQLIDATSKVTQYVHTLRGSTRDREKLQNELKLLIKTLGDLQTIAEKAQTQPDTSALQTRALLQTDGPLATLKLSIDSLTKKLVPSNGRNTTTSSARSGSWSLKTIGQHLAWPAQKQSCVEIFNDVKRLNTYILLALAQDLVSDSWQVRQKLAAIPKIDDAIVQVDSGVKRLGTAKISEARQMVRSWLSPLNFNAIHQDLLSEFQPGSCTSFLDGPEINDWCTGNKTRLWCTGIPGAGKTTAVAALVHRLRERFPPQDGIKVASIFCNFKMTDSLSLVNIIASIWWQATAFADLSEEAVQLYQKHNELGTRPTVPEMLKLLQQDLMKSTTMLVVIDALDELPEQLSLNLVVELAKFQMSVTSNFNIMITSRLQPATTMLRSLSDPIYYTISASTPDLERYIDHQIKNDASLHNYTQTRPELASDIREAVIRRSGQMFLMAKLHLETLSRQDSISAIRREIQKLPEDCDSVYDECISRIMAASNPRRIRARELLLWISTATRTLAFTELQSALSIRTGQTMIESEDLCDLKSIVTSCAGMVVMDSESQSVRFVHATFQEYLTTKNVFQSLEPDSVLASACLTYLQFSEFAKGRCESDEEMLSRMEKYPLLLYAASYWHVHVRDAQCSREEHAQLLRKVFVDDGLRDTVQQAISLPSGRFEGFSITHPRSPTGLWLAAYYGLDDLSSYLLELGNNVNQPASDESTPLCIASGTGHLSMVKLLIDSGADLNGNTVKFPLYEAARAGHEIVVDMLLSQGALSAKSGLDGRNAMHAAVIGDRAAVVELLLKYEPDVAAYIKNGQWTPLHSAAANGAALSCAVILNQPNIPCDVETFDGETPLHIAIEHHFIAMIRLLLEKGANPLVSNRFGRNAFHLAAGSNNLDVCKLILGSIPIINKAINGRDYTGQTPLHKAASCESWEIIELLLQYQADPNQKDTGGRSPLDLITAASKRDIMGNLLMKYQGKYQDNGIPSLKRSAIADAAVSLPQPRIDHGDLAGSQQGTHDEGLPEQVSATRKDAVRSSLRFIKGKTNITAKTSISSTDQREAATISSGSHGNPGPETHPQSRIAASLSLTGNLKPLDASNPLKPSRYSGGKKRVEKELKDFLKRPAPHCTITHTSEEGFDWIVSMQGPADSDYAGGRFILEINFPDDYPFREPNIFFRTKIYHTNIDEEGTICLRYFSSNPCYSKWKDEPANPRLYEGRQSADSWNPAYTVRHCLVEIIYLLVNPDGDEYSRFPGGRLYAQNRKLYHKTARQWTERYAT